MELEQRHHFILAIRALRSLEHLAELSNLRPTLQEQANHGNPVVANGIKQRCLAVIIWCVDIGSGIKQSRHCVGVSPHAGKVHRRLANAVRCIGGTFLEKSPQGRHVSVSSCF